MLECLPPVVTPTLQRFFVPRQKSVHCNERGEEGYKCTSQLTHAIKFAPGKNGKIFLEFTINFNMLVVISSSF